MSSKEIYSFVARLCIITLFLLCLWLVYQVRDILGAMLLAVITASIVSPLLEAQERHKVPPALATAFFLLGAIAILLIGAGIIFPLLAEQAIRFEGLLRQAIQTLHSFTMSPESMIG